MGFKDSLHVQNTYADAKLDQKHANNYGRKLIQLLGGDPFIEICGAKDFYVDGQGGILFKIRRNLKNISHVKISLNNMNTYDFEFMRVRVNKRKTISTEELVYAEDLRKVFEQHTGLKTSL